jgi:predicted PurR-regulated permease PerM
MKTTNRRPVRRGHGALIIMVLLAIAIILVLMFGSFGGGGSYSQQLSQTRKQGRALAQDLETRQLSILIAQYRVENNRLPKSAADLENDIAFRDRWGGTITFTFQENTGGPTTVIYHSNGPDGVRGTEDDIEKRETLPY